jgi:hypothetical protein
VAHIHDLSRLIRIGNGDDRHRGVLAIPVLDLPIHEGRVPIEHVFVDPLLRRVTQLLRVGRLLVHGLQIRAADQSNEETEENGFGLHWN